MRHFVFGVVVSLVALSAFGQPAATATITGVVKSGDGTVIPGVTITVSGPSLQGTRSTVTSDEGRYRFTGLPPGKYRITAEMSGFATVTRNTEAVIGSAATVDITFGMISETPTVTGTIKGTVKSGGTALKGAKVVIHNRSGDYTLETDADGYYEQTSLTPGPWRITVSKSGYETKDRSVTLRDNETLREDFDLPTESGR